MTITNKITDDTILDCGHKPSPHSEISTGYGKTADGRTICWSCGAEIDRAAMIRDGHSKTLPLYLTVDKNDKPVVSNWPGSLTFPVWYRSTCATAGFGGRSRRTWVRFNGPDGYVWSGFQQGESNSICHARRTRERIAA